MMAKRTRDTSSSLSGDEAISDSTKLSSEPDDLRNTKLAAYDDSAVNQNKYVMHCSLPPHSKSVDFLSLEEFEVHYAKEHTNRCVECGRNLPSGHFLALHLDENHNPLREALAAKGEKTYACFLPECEKKCSNPHKRRMHLIDKHGFPKIYNFRVINNGIDNANTMLQEGRRRRVSLVNGEPSIGRQRAGSAVKPVELTPSPDSQSRAEMEASFAQSKPDRSTIVQVDNVLAGPAPPNRSKISTSPSTSDNVDELERSLAALQFVPRSVLTKGGKK